MSFSQALPCLYPHYTTAGIALQEKAFDKCRQKEPEIPCRCLHDKPADKIEADKREEKITALLLQLQLPFLFTFTLALTLGYFFRNRRFQKRNIDSLYKQVKEILKQQYKKRAREIFSSGNFFAPGCVYRNMLAALPDSLSCRRTIRPIK